MQTRSSSGSTSSMDAVPMNAVPVGDVARLSGKCSWQPEDDLIFVQYLITHQEQLSSGGFQKAVFQGAAQHLKSNGPPQRGVEKTADSCRLRWKKVCVSLYAFYLFPDLYY